MWKRTRELARAAPSYFWAWWQHEPPPPIELGPVPVVLPPLLNLTPSADAPPAAKRQRVEPSEDSTDTTDTLDAPVSPTSPPSPDALRSSPWRIALNLLQENGVDDKFLTLVKGAVDQCLEGCYEAHDLVLVDCAMQTQRALVLLHQDVVTEIRSMVDDSAVPANGRLVYDFVQFEPRLRRAHTRVAATQH